MISNLRAKPIEGHVTDSAGNVLRNAKIVIKSNTPTGVNVIDYATSDDNGYFKSSPIPNGSYDIYESGIRVSRLIHSSDQDAIQVFKAHTDNYNTNVIESFSDIIGSSGKQLNDFKLFLQIEDDNIDIANYGNIFPLYDMDLTQLELSISTYYNLQQFFGFETESRITTTRFDIEYYSPLTSLSQVYKRIRWSGVPAIRYYEDSKLVIPLDYYSMVATLPKTHQPIGGTAFTAGTVTYDAAYSDDKLIIGESAGGDESYENFYSSVFNGDLVKAYLEGLGDWYGIVVNKVSTNKQITMKKWLTSRSEYESITPSSAGGNIVKLDSYDGMFQGIVNINEDTDSLFTVVENVSVQNEASESYTYDNAS